MALLGINAVSQWRQYVSAYHVRPPSDLLHIKTYWEVKYIYIYKEFRLKHILICSDFKKKLGMYAHILVKLSCIKFDENPFHSHQVVICGHTSRQTDTGKPTASISATLCCTCHKWKKLQMYKQPEMWCKCTTIITYHLRTWLASVPVPSALTTCHSNPLTLDIPGAPQVGPVMQNSCFSAAVYQFHYLHQFL